MIFPWKHGYGWDLTAWLPAGQEKPGGFPQHARLPERERERSRPGTWKNTSFWGIEWDLTDLTIQQPLFEVGLNGIELI